MAKAPPYTLRVQLAAMGSAMPKEQRHLVHVMSLLAGQNSGSGTHGQGTMAAAMGVSERHVRALLKELERPDSSPVRVERRARFRGEGRGRTSDEWRLVLVRDQPAPRSGYSVDQPEHRAGESDGLTGTPRTTNRNATHDQPEHRAGDLRSDLRSDLHLEKFSDGSSSERSKTSPKTATKSKATKASKKTTKAATKTAHPLAQELKFHYIGEFQRSRGTQPGFGRDWSRAMKSLGLLADKVGLEGAKLVITNALDQKATESFRPPVEPWDLVRRCNTLLGATSTNPGSPWRQSGGEAVKVNEEAF